MYTQVSGAQVVPRWSPWAEPIEFVTTTAAAPSSEDSPPTSSLILLHGIAMSSSTYVDGDAPFGLGHWPSYALKAFLGQDIPGVRCVLLSSPKTKAPAVLETLKMFPPDPDGRNSWVDQVLSGWSLPGSASSDTQDDAPQAYNWNLDDAKGAVDYVHNIIRTEIERGMPSERIFVMGHSQGGMIGSRAALTFPDARLGGLIMLSSLNASPDMVEVVAPAQKGLKILAGHSADDKMLKYEITASSYEILKAAVGHDNFTFIEEPDNEDVAKHAPFCDSLKDAFMQLLKA